MRTLRLSMVLCGVGALWTSNAASASEVIVLDTASGEVLTNGVVISDNIYAFHRFEIIDPTQLTTLGGVFQAPSPSPPDLAVFAAIVTLSGATDLPDSPDLSTPDVVATALLPVGTAAELYTTGIDVGLAPGWYALVYGTGAFGAPSSAEDPSIVMPSLAVDLVSHENPVSIRQSDGAFIIQGIEPRFYAAGTSSVSALKSWLGAQGGVTTTDNRIMYSGSPVGWANTVTSVPLSTLGFTDNFEVRFRLDSDPSDTTWGVGLGTSETGPDWRDIDFGLRSSDGMLEIRENGIWRTTTRPLATGDILSIRAGTGAIEYRLNSVTVYNSSYNGTQAFYVDTAFKQGSISMSVFVDDDARPGVTPVRSWLRESGGVETSVGQIVYSGHPIGWWNNTATSARFSTVGLMDDYEARFTINSDPIGTTWIVGLGSEENGAHWTDIEFGLRSSEGRLEIREDGLWRTGGGLLSTGDALSIRVSNGAIEYSVNGTIIYTSTYAGSPDFYVDSSFRNGVSTYSNRQGIALGVTLAR